MRVPGLLNLVATRQEVKKGNYADKKKRFAQKLCSLAYKNSHRRLVFFINEAQNLQVEHYKFLISLYNMLAKMQVSPAFISVGQPQLAERRNAMVIAKENQIIGRFMLHEIEYEGLRGLKDIEACLRCFDEKTEFPAGSGCSFTAHFFPEAYRHGWRLVSQAATIWEVFSQVRKGMKLPEQLPMSYFCAALEYVLQAYSNHIDDEPRLSHVMWSEGVDISGYSQSGG